MLLGFEGPDLTVWWVRGTVFLVSVGWWVMVFWPVGSQRVVAAGGTDRTLRTTQWTRASTKHFAWIFWWPFGLSGWMGVNVFVV